MTNFNGIPKFNPHEITTLPDQKFKRWSPELRDEIEFQCKQIFSNSDYLQSLYENNFDLVDTLDESTLNKFVDALSAFFSGKYYIDGFFAFLQNIDLKYATIFYSITSFIKVETE
jgi:hypothetical protein